MKDKSLPNAKCIRLACENLKIKHSFFDNNKNVIAVYLDKPYFFVNCSTPFNDESTSRICKDKDFSYKILKDVIRMPKTISFYDPNREGNEHQIYIKEKNCKEITDKILKNFSFPIIIKRNFGAQGKNVFLCENKRKVLKALSNIYNKKTSGYDYIALAQKYIEVNKEYRVIVFDKEILLVYEKDISNAKFKGNISPLHYENSKSIQVTDKKLISEISQFIKPIFEKINLKYTGLDIVIDKKNKFHLIELNTTPGFSHFIESNGEEEIIKVYEKIFKKVMKKN